MQFINPYWVVYEPNTWLSYDDVTLIPQESDLKSRHDPRISLKTKLTNSVSMNIPIISANMDTVTGSKMAKTMHAAGGVGILHRFYPSKSLWEEEIEELLTEKILPCFSIGLDETYNEYIEYVLKRSKYAIVCLDVANGHLLQVARRTRKLMEQFGQHIQVIAGNVCTPNAALQLIDAGAAAIKVGIGGGSLCSTRLVTGHGIPTLSAIMQIRRTVYARKSNCAIIADGGIKNSGDIVKALAAGADSVMIGNLLAASSETPGEIYFKDGNSFTTTKSHDWANEQWYKLYRGQASSHFMADIGKNGVTPEGVHMYLPYKGDTSKILEELIMGIKSGMTYTGAKDLKELYKLANFAEISSRAYVEGTPHGSN